LETLRKEKEHLGDTGIDGRVIKWFLKNYGMTV
jgi:hypothetical protein